MDPSTLISRLEAARDSFHNLERQLADPDVASDPTRLQSIARERSRLEPLVNDSACNRCKRASTGRELLRDSRGDEEMANLAQLELEELDKRHES